MPGEPTTAMTFSQREKESSLQLVEPVQTASPSLITYLWCMRSGTPGIGFVGTSSASTRLGSPRGGGGSGIGISWSTLKARRTAAPREAASVIASATSFALSCSRSKS